MRRFKLNIEIEANNHEGVLEALHNISHQSLYAQLEEDEEEQPENHRLTYKYTIKVEDRIEIIAEG